MTGHITPAQLAAVRKRHADIPQDGLPGLDIAAHRADEPTRARAVKSVAFATCPHHVEAGTKTGLIPGPKGSGLVFREHTKRVGKVTMPCPGSGQEWSGATSASG